MATEIKDIYDKLKQIKDNLVKLSYSKRTQSVLQQKLTEADKLRDQFDECIHILSKQIGKKQVSSTVLEEIQSYGDLIKELYIQIETFCSKDYSSVIASSSKAVKEIESKTTNMENFNFKTAVSLLPLMNGDENVTKTLIDAIEFYSSTLTEQGKVMLIKFVLKTRLTQNAKLRLGSSYDTCELLINDMRHHLLTKKSSTAIHNELMQIRQNALSINEYGNQIEQLFVDLTISQADGNQDAYKILLPINEKIAIKSFTDGLQNRQLSTILSARNYTALKDTIRAAKDEESSCNRQETDASMYLANRGRTGTYRYSRSNNNRGRYRRAFTDSVRGGGQQNTSSGHQQPRNDRDSRANIRGQYRGRQNRYFTRSGNINFVENTNQNNSESIENQTDQNSGPQNSQDSQNTEPIQFFR